jgi:hypothetical protein
MKEQPTIMLILGFWICWHANQHNYDNLSFIETAPCVEMELMLLWTYLDDHFMDILYLNFNLIIRHNIKCIDSQFF